MQQNKDELAGQLTLDLDGCTVTPLDVDDRRHVFQVRKDFLISSFHLIFSLNYMYSAFTGAWNNNHLRQPPPYDLFFFSTKITGASSHSSKKVVVLQAESKHQYEEWLSTLLNISAGLYLHDDPKQAVRDARHKEAAASSTPSSVDGSVSDLSEKLPGRNSLSFCANKVTGIAVVRN